MSVHFGQLLYDGSYMYPGRNVDIGTGEWWGTELQLVSSAWERHKLIAGLEYRDDFLQNQINYDAVPYTLYLDDRRNTQTFGIYAQDEYAFADRWKLSAGLRYDTSSGVEAALHPRVALLHQLLPTMTAKLLYGTAYRAPSAYEKYYVTNATIYKTNPNLVHETIQTSEFVLEYYPFPDLRITGSVYGYDIEDMISLTTDPLDGKLVFRNIDTVHAHGLEGEVEKTWRSGARLRFSYAWQEAENGAGQPLTNSPRNLVKLNASAPMLDGAWRGGLEVQYVDQRLAPLSGSVDGYAVVNLTLNSDRLARNTDVSIGLYNLLDAKYADPASEEHVDILGRRLTQIPQDGRNVRLKIIYRF